MRDLGVRIGRLPPGVHNAITDVAGVRVGHTTLSFGTGRLREGEGPVRTGVTVVLPHSGNLFERKVPAALDSINGFGRVTGTTQVDEFGLLETPVVLTNTLSVGAAYDGVVTLALRANPGIGVADPKSTGVNPVVAECNDAYLNDMRGRHVRPEHVLEAVARAAGGPPEEGCVGAGTGMTCYGWKAGIGTSSRMVPKETGGWTVGALVVANFGRPRELTIAGVRVGEELQPPRALGGAAAPAGSCMVVVATDAPASARQLKRLARRGQSGIARTGTASHNYSGEYTLAFSTAYSVQEGNGHEREIRELAEAGDVMDVLFEAVIEAVEEAICNSLFVADTTTGADDNIIHGLPVDRVLSLLRS